MDERLRLDNTDSITLFGQTLSLPLTDGGKDFLAGELVESEGVAVAREVLMYEAFLPRADRVFVLTLAIPRLCRENAREARELITRAIRLSRELEGEERQKALVACADCLYQDFHDSMAALALYEEADIPDSDTPFLTLDQHGLDDILRTVVFSDLWQRDWEKLFHHIAAVHGREQSEGLFDEIGNLLLEQGEVEQVLRLADVQGEHWDHYGPLHLKILQHVFSSQNWELAKQTLDKIAAHPIGVGEQELAFCQHILELPVEARREKIQRLQDWRGYGTLGEEGWR